MTHAIHHALGDAVVALDGTAGDILHLQGEGAIAYEWSPSDKQAIDLELRARLVETSAPFASIPIVRWYMEVGHGDYSWSFPPDPFPVVFGSPTQAQILPARGLLLKLSARRFRIWFAGGLDIAGAVVASNKVAVSVQPSMPGKQCCAAEWYTQYAAPLGGPAPLPRVQPLPMAARDLRIRTPLIAQPFAIGACAVDFRGVVGGALGIIDVALGGYSDFQPIPALANILLTSVAAQVDFR